jgi:menaquinone-dependent protoporphyrinogen IX oxidase
MGRRRHIGVGAGLVALGLSIALVSVLGPLVMDVIRYRTSPTSVNQIVGSDAAGLFLVAPFSVTVGVLVLLGRPLASLGLAPAVYAAYIYPQLALGNEFQVRAGTVELFFPLLLGVFLLAVAVAGASWRAAGDDPLVVGSRRHDRLAGVLLLAAAAVVTFGLHLPTYLDAISGSPSNAGYLSSPTAFWLVKFMDLGIVVPAAVVVGLGLLADRAWARRPMQTIVGSYAFLATSVSAMAVVMYANDDPDASWGQVMVASGVALALLGLFASLQRGPFDSCRGGRTVRARADRESVMRVLVTAASRHGSTAGIAERIAGALRVRGIAVDTLAPGAVHDVTGYDGVVVGSAIYEGRWLRAARGVLTRTSAQLAGTKVWLFSSGPVGDPPQPAEAPDVSDAMVRTGALEHRLFGGRMDPGSLGPVEKALVRLVHSPAGDFRDDAAVVAWASQIADTLLLTARDTRASSAHPSSVDRGARMQ